MTCKCFASYGPPGHILKEFYFGQWLSYNRASYFAGCFSFGAFFVYLVFSFLLKDCEFGPLRHCAHTCHSTCVKVRGQAGDVGFLLGIGLRPSDLDKRLCSLNELT